jgi:hypothetical protein
VGDLNRRYLRALPGISKRIVLWLAVGLLAIGFGVMFVPMTLPNGSNPQNTWGGFIVFVAVCLGLVDSLISR